MKHRFILWIACFLLLVAGAANAQDSGVTGVVTDATGAVIPRVKVTLTHSGTGAAYETTTNDVGVYLFAKVPPGSGYKLTFVKEGFATLTISDATLGVNRTETFNVQLELGEVTTEVVVEATATVTLNTTDASIGNVIQGGTFKELPIQLRQSPARFLGLQPGVVANSGGGANRDGAVTGARTDQGNITLDGMVVNDQAGGLLLARSWALPLTPSRSFVP